VIIESFARILLKLNKKDLKKNLAKKTHHNLRQTLANFTVCGHLTKIGEDKFFNLKPKGFEGRENGYAACKMSVKTALDNTVNGIEISGNEQKEVRLSWKKNDVVDSAMLPWNDRYNEKLIKAASGGAEASLSFAKTIGLYRESYVDRESGETKEHTVRKRLTGYDAVYEIKKAIEDKRLTDETSVYLKGKVKPNTWVRNNNGEIETGKSIKLEADTMTVTAKPIILSELTEEEKAKNATFTMEIVFKEFNKVDETTYMTGIVVGYDFIEEMEFQFKTEALAEGFKKLVAPHMKKGIYPMLLCKGEIRRQVVEEELAEPIDNGLGVDIYGAKRTGQTRQVWVIGFGDINSLDVTSYTVANVDEAKEQLKAYAVDYKAGKDLSVESTEDKETISLGADSYKSNSMNDFEDDDEDWD
jgi:hypothetical protein